MNSETEIIVAYTHNVSSGGIRVHRLPKPGETIRALDTNTGIDCAKGTNVAVAASRIGARVALVAAVPGGDWYERGQKILDQEGVDDSFVQLQPGERKTSGCVIIDDEGNNMIILSSGGQQSISKDQIQSALKAYPKAQYCVTGYELNPDSVHWILESARALGVKTILNPSPVPERKPDFWHLVDILVLNEVELSHMLSLAGRPVTEDWRENAENMQKIYGCAQIVITLGERGFFSLDERKIATRGQAIEVQPYDTTGAGDGFLGAMTARLAAGDSLGDACAWANRYASFTVQRPGTISSYPTRKEQPQLWTEN